VWIINYSFSAAKRTDQNRIVNQWMRQYAGSSLEKVFDACGIQKKAEKQDALQVCSSDMKILVKDSLVLEYNRHRRSNHHSDRCVLYNSRSPLQMTFFKDLKSPVGIQR
jgi:hypothetical protein